MPEAEGDRGQQGPGDIAPGERRSQRGLHATPGDFLADAEASTDTAIHHTRSTGVPGMK